MIQIDGTDYAEPTDKAIIAYSGGDYVLVSVGDALRRVDITEFGAGWITENMWAIGKGWRHDASEFHFETQGIFKIGGGVYYPCIWFRPGSGALENITYQTTPDSSYGHKFYGKMYIDKQCDDWYTLVLTGTGGEREAVADAWLIWGCSETLKTDMVEISDALEKICSVRGITYIQEGVPGTCISAEDLDRLGLPGLTRKDNAGEYEAINPVGCIPLLLQGIKELSMQIQALEKRIASLEGGQV